jgi:hypothetical protein
MSHFTLNCPHCGKWLINIPLDGLTLHYRCEAHGLLVFKPLALVAADDLATSGGPSGSSEVHAHDAA